MKNKFFYFAVLPALFFQFLGAYLYFVAFNGEDFSQIIYFATKVLLVLWPLSWLFYTRSLFLPMYGGNLKKSALFGFSSGVLIFTLVSLFYFLSSDFLLSFVDDIVAAAQGLNFLEHYIVFSVFIIVIHSFIEEYYWRWFVLNGLMMKFSKKMAVIIVSLAFASHHFIVVFQFVPFYLALLATILIFFLGVFWSILYLRTKNLIAPWISHLFADAVIMGIGYLLIST